MEGSGGSPSGAPGFALIKTGLCRENLLLTSPDGSCQELAQGNSGRRLPPPRVFHFCSQLELHLGFVHAPRGGEKEAGLESVISLAGQDVGT